MGNRKILGRGVVSKQHVSATEGGHTTLQGYLVHRKQPPLRTLRWAYA